MIITLIYWHYIPGRSFSDMAIGLVLHFDEPGHKIDIRKFVVVS